jgi:hypothetical protein
MNVVWECPVASTAFTEGVTLKLLPKREYVLRFSYENDEDSLDYVALHFLKVVAFRCTHLPALTAEMVQCSYDKLADLGETPWLKEAQARVANCKVQLGQIRHLQITFDDGPCYEFLCESHTLDTKHTG